MKKYTLGFIFNVSMDKVVLITKERPPWQAGKLNGVGGKVEAGETTIRCMVREAEEETGLPTRENDWAHVATMKGSEWQVDVFALVHAGEESAVRTCTDEEVSWYPIGTIPQNRNTNVQWLIELSKDKLRNNTFERAMITYR